VTNAEWAVCGTSPGKHSFACRSSAPSRIVLIDRDDDAVVLSEDYDVNVPVKFRTEPKSTLIVNNSFWALAQTLIEFQRAASPFVRSTQ